MEFVRSSVSRQAWSYRWPFLFALGATMWWKGSVVMHPEDGSIAARVPWQWLWTPGYVITGTLLLLAAILGPRRPWVQWLGFLGLATMSAARATSLVQLLGWEGAQSALPEYVTIILLAAMSGGWTGRIIADLDKRAT